MTIFLSMVNYFVELELLLDRFFLFFWLKICWISIIDVVESKALLNFSISSMGMVNELFTSLINQSCRVSFSLFFLYLYKILSYHEL